MKNKSTEERYLNFMTNLSNRQRGFRSINKLIAKFHLSKAIAPALVKKRLLKNINGVWKWTGATPGPLMAMDVLRAVNSSIQKNSSAAKMKMNGQTKNSSSNFKFINHAKGGTKVIVHKYVPKNNDILDLSSLRELRASLENKVVACQTKIAKIDSLFESVESFKK